LLLNRSAIPAILVRPASSPDRFQGVGSCIVSSSGRVLAGIEAGEGFVVHELSMAKAGIWRRTATYLEDRRDHEDLYRRLLST